MWEVFKIIIHIIGTWCCFSAPRNFVSCPQNILARERLCIIIVARKRIKKKLMTGVVDSLKYQDSNSSFKKKHKSRAKCVWEVLDFTKYSIYLSLAQRIWKRRTSENNLRNVQITNP